MPEAWKNAYGFFSVVTHSPKQESKLEASSTHPPTSFLPKSFIFLALLSRASGILSHGSELPFTFLQVGILSHSPSDDASQAVQVRSITSVLVNHPYTTREIRGLMTGEKDRRCFTQTTFASGEEAPKKKRNEGIG